MKKTKMARMLNIKSLENVQVAIICNKYFKKCSDFKKKRIILIVIKFVKDKKFFRHCKNSVITFDFVGYQAIKRYKILMNLNSMFGILII